MQRLAVRVAWPPAGRSVDSISTWVAHDVGVGGGAEVEVERRRAGEVRRLDGADDGPPPGPGFSEIRPCTSSRRSASRSDVRLTPYSSTIAASRGSRSPVPQAAPHDVADDLLGHPLGRLHRARRAPRGA